MNIKNYYLNYYLDIIDKIIISDIPVHRKNNILNLLKKDYEIFTSNKKLVNKYNTLLKSIEKVDILFIEPNILSFSTVMESYVLRKNGFSTGIIVRDDNDYNEEKRFFDFIINCRNCFLFLHFCDIAQASWYVVTVGYRNFFCEIVALGKPIERIIVDCPDIRYDDSDVLYNERLKNDYYLDSYTYMLEKCKYFKFKTAYNGFYHSLNYFKIKNKNLIPIRIMPFVPKDFFVKKEIKHNDKLKFVFAGSVEHQYGLIEFVKLLRNYKSNLTFFLNPYENNILNDLHRKIKGYEYIKIIKGLKYEKFFKELSNFSVGLLYNTIYEKNTYHMEDTFFTCKKIGSYIAAGLPILTHPSCMEISIFVLKNDIGWSMTLDDLKNGGFDKIKNELPQKVSNLLKIRDQLSLDFELKKLTKYLKL